MKAIGYKEKFLDAVLEFQNKLVANKVKFSNPYSEDKKFRELYAISEAALVALDFYPKEEEEVPENI